MGGPPASATQGWLYNGPSPKSYVVGNVNIYIQWIRDGDKVTGFVEGSTPTDPADMPYRKMLLTGSISGSEVILSTSGLLAQSITGLLSGDELSLQWSSQGPLVETYRPATEADYNAALNS